jgi:anti-sigma regulatory factor (Ser/Thr protein kinase)
MIATAPGPIDQEEDLVHSVVLDYSDDRSPSLARAAVRMHLAGDNLDSGDAELVASELVTNAIQEVRKLEWPDAPLVGLTVAIKTEVVVVTVWDASPHPPVVASTLPNPVRDETGRGLILVDALADWHWYFCQGGKAIKATLRAVEARKTKTTMKGGHNYDR